MASELYNWDLTNLAKSTTEMTKKPILGFFNFHKCCPFNSNKIKILLALLHHIRVLYVQWQQNQLAEIKETKPNSPKVASERPIFSIFLKHVEKDSNESFYSHYTPY